MSMWESDEEVERMYVALMHLDMEYAREMMHKVRYELVTMPPALRHESRAWLEKFGFNRFGQLPWPPEGELEE